MGGAIEHEMETTGFVDRREAEKKHLCRGSEALPKVNYPFQEVCGDRVNQNRGYSVRSKSVEAENGSCQ